MNNDHGNEMRGRLQLWYLALSASRRLLGDAKRAATLRDQLPDGPTLVEMDDEYFARTPFGSRDDLERVRINFVILAAIYFWQLFETGSGASGKVGKNLAKHVTELRNGLIEAAFSDSSAREEFDQMHQLIKDLRHRVFAHAAGDAFSVRHAETMTVSSSFTAEARRIDVDNFLAVVDRLFWEIDRQRQTMGFSVGWIG